MPALYYINNTGALIHTNNYEKRLDGSGYNINKTENDVNVIYFVPVGREVTIWHGPIEDFPRDDDRIGTKIGNIHASPPPEISLVQGGGSRKKKRKSKRNKSKNKRSKKKKSKKKSKKR